MSLPTVLVLLAVACGVGRTAAGQEVERRRAFGIVFDAAGAPWRGANVALEFRVDPRLRAAPYVDRVDAVTDDRGEFHVELLPGSRYAVWARGEVADDESYRRTEVVLDAVAGTPIVLREQARGFVRSVHYSIGEGDSSWAGHEPRFTVAERWEVAEPWLYFDLPRRRELQCGPDGSVRVPPSPVEWAILEVWHGGFVVERLQLPLTAAAQQESLGARPGAALRAPLSRRVSRVLSPVDHRRIRVVGADGLPVAGARLTDLDGPPWIPAAAATMRTDERGEVEVVLPASMPRARLRQEFAIRAEGHAESFLRPFDEMARAARDVDPRLRKGHEVLGALYLTEGWPLGATPILVESALTVANHGDEHDAGARVIQAAADGSIVVPGRHRETRYRLTAALAPWIRARLAGEGFPTAPVALIQGECRDPLDALGTVRLDELPALDIEVRNPDGTPSGSAELLVSQVRMGSRWPRRPLRISTDHRGRIRLIVRDPENLALFVRTAMGSALRVLEGTERRVELELDAGCVVPLRLRHPDGRPAEVNVSFGVSTAGEGYRALPLRSHFQQQFTDAEGRADFVLPLAVESPVFRIGNQRVELDREARGADGVFEIVVPGR